MELLQYAIITNLETVLRTVLLKFVCDIAILNDATISQSAPVQIPPAGTLLRIFQWRGQLRKGTPTRKGKVEKCTVWGSGDSFEFPRLDFQ